MNQEAAPATLLKQGRMCLAKGHVHEAEQIAQQLDTRYPDNPTVLTFVAEIAMAVRDPATAERVLRRALKLAPQDPRLPLMYAGALAAGSRQPEAVQVLEQAARLRPDDATHLQAVGAFMSKLGEHVQAHDLFRKALDLEPENAQLCQNLAAVQRFLGNFAEAEAYAERAIRLDPMTPEAVFIRSDVRTVTAEHNHIDDIRRLITEQKVSGSVLAQCQFALAKEYEDIGQWTDSFVSLSEACALRRKTFTYNVRTDTDRMNDVRKHFGTSFFTNPPAGYHGERVPVFILGMPRTGSTLVERFLTAHSAITSAGERQEFSALLARQTQAILNQSGRGQEHLVAAAAEMDFEQLGRDYLAATSSVSGDTPYFIDKLPLNFLYIGLILTALPDARIIHTVRHPMDTCYAVFKMLFDRAYPFSYNLEELADYYIAYRELMTHWKSLFGDRVFEVSYESVVLDTEPTIRGALESLGLDWEEGCRSNMGGSTASTTASAAQARKPVYATSIGMWKNYQEPLEPLRQRLEQHGIDID